MAKNLHKFTLTPEESVCLRQAVCEDEILLSAIDSDEKSLGGRLTLELELETAEKLREYLTEQLAKTGFDKDYSLSKEGAILETLIDKFYIT